MAGENLRWLIGIIVATMGVWLSYLQYRRGTDSKPASKNRPTKQLSSHSQVPNLEAALRVANEIWDSYSADKERSRIFDEALQSGDTDFALKVIKHIDDPVLADICRTKIAKVFSRT